MRAIWMASVVYMLIDKPLNHSLECMRQARWRTMNDDEMEAICLNSLLGQTLSRLRPHDRRADCAICPERTFQSSLGCSGLMIRAIYIQE